MNVNLSLDVPEKRILILLELVPPRVVRVARETILTPCFNKISYWTLNAIVSRASLVNNIYHIISLAVLATNSH
jgi:hypothetical protein